MQPNQFKPPMRWVALGVITIASTFVVGVGALSLGVSFMAPQARAETLSEAREVLPLPRSCRECGWIESKRSVPSGADNLSIRSDEYTVRMGDGSTRIFTGGPAERWRLGERLKFIDGEL
jgi:hypothetical protein